MTPRILLLQARSLDDPAKKEELDSFARRAGLPTTCFTPHDLLHGPPTLAEARRYDALMIGGSGEFNVSDRSLPRIEQTCAFLRQVVDAGHPLFASCFGFQLLVEALGGEIVRDRERMEIGTFATTLTSAGREDELFRYLPAVFPAQYGHNERAARLPEMTVNLAFSELCPYQALRVPGKPIWATQFHPELSGEENRQRFLRYQDLYIGLVGKEEFERILAGFSASPETEELAPRFIELIIG